MHTVQPFKTCYGQRSVKAMIDKTAQTEPTKEPISVVNTTLVVSAPRRIDIYSMDSSSRQGGKQTR